MVFSSPECISCVYDVVSRAASAALHTPQLGGMLSQGPKIQSSHHFAPKKPSIPQIEIWSTRNQWSWGSFERKVLIYYSYFGPLWKQGITHYNCCCRPLWKQSSLLIHCSCYWDPVESVVSLLTHYSCYCGPLWKSRTYTLQSLLWSLSMQSTYTMQLLLGALVKQSNCTLQLLLGAFLKAD